MPVIGVDAKAYRSTSADYALPVWAELTNLRDVQLGMEVEDFDATVRGVAFVQHLPTLFDLEVTTNALWETTDAGLQSILTTAWSRSFLDMAFVDQNIATTGADGMRAAWGVFSNSRSEALREGLALDWTFRPFSTGDPATIPQRWISP